MVRTAAGSTSAAQPHRAARYAAEEVPALEILRSLARGSSLLALLLGTLFILGYPWLLALHAAQAAGSIASDLSLALVWLAPEVYLLSGMVKAAEYANANRSALLGLIAPGVSLVAQLLVMPLAQLLAPAVSATVNVWGLQGGILMWAVPVTLFAASSAIAAMVASAVPRVVPGKFGRTIGPQLAGLSLLFVALLLPHWGGISAARFGLDIGMPTLWVNVIAVFVFSLFALVWFQSKD